MRILMGTCFLLAITAFAQPPATPAQLAATDHNQDVRRTTAIEAMRADLKKIEDRRQAAAVEYEAELKKLTTAREELRAKHAKAALDAAAKLKTINDSFQKQVDAIRVKRTKATEANTVKVAELDKELKSIQDRAREQYTDEIDKELKAHGDKRKAQEAARAASLATIEDERVVALNAYFDALTAQEQAELKETQVRDAAKGTQIADHAKKAEELTQKYNDQLTALSSERAKLIQKSTDQLYGFLEVPSRTVPPVVAGAASPVPQLPKGQTVEMAITYDDHTFAPNDPKGIPFRDAVNQVLAGKYVEGFTFAEKGEILYKLKPLSVEFVYTVDGVALALSESDSLKLDQRLLSALVQNLYRAPKPDLGAVMWQPLDISGKAISFRDAQKVDAVVKAVFENRRENLGSATLVDEQTFEVDGIKVRIQWSRLKRTDSGAPYSEAFTRDEERQAADRNWRLALQRTFTPISVPREVRAKLAKQTDPNAASSMAIALQAPERCKDYVFLRYGTGQVVIARKKDKVILFTASGITDLSHLACADNSLAFIGQGVKRTAAGKFDLVKNPGADIKAADLVATDTELQSKDKVPTLFAVSGDTVKLAIVTPEGALAKVSTVLKDKKASGFRAWAADDKKEWIVDFTILVSVDALTAAPDVGSKPEVAAEFSAEAIK